MLTIFTPTYNREATLERLYDSLRNQTNLNFEWIIVDDGSEDNTKVLIEKFINDKKIKIIYKKVKNGGKMRAINEGVRLSNKNSLFFVVDSDDYLSLDAVEIIYQDIKKLPKEYAGLVYKKIEFKKNNDIPNYMTETKNEFIDSTPIDIFYRKKILGDKAEIVKTAILEKYPFPEIVNEKFIPEGYIWNRIGEKYKFRYIDKGIYYFDYLDDGYTRQFKKIIKNNPKGMKLYYSYMLKKDIPILNKIKFFIRYIQSEYYDLIKK